MKIRISFILTAFILLLASCDKHHAKKLSGTYSCRVQYNYWDMTPLHIDSVYYEDIEIEQDGKLVKVAGTSIHIDSLWEEKEYEQWNIYGYLKVLFRNDSVYILISNGGLGGSSTLRYEGMKK